MAKQDGEKGSDEDGIGRELISIVIVTGTGLFIMAFALVGIYNASGFSDIKDLLNILLPVVGTWMGIVLAYYFSKKNFEAANEHTTALVNQVLSTGEKLDGIKVNEVMLNPPASCFHISGHEHEFWKMPLDTIIHYMENGDHERVAYLDKDHKFIFLLYRSTVDRFIAEYILREIKGNHHIHLKGKLNDNTLCVQDMKDSGIIQENIPCFKLFKNVLDNWIEDNKKKHFISINDPLSKAWKAMQNNVFCADVFVTEKGSPEEEILGWITNDIISDNAELFKTSGVY